MAHQRDIAMLETMIQQTCAENERLKATVAAWEIAKPGISRDIPERGDRNSERDTATDGRNSEAGTISHMDHGRNSEVPSRMSTTSMVDEPEMEPRRTTIGISP